MRAEAQEDPTRPSRRIYDAVLANVQRQGGGDIEVPPFESVRSAVERTRSALVPPIPTTGNSGIWGTAERGSIGTGKYRNDSAVPQRLGKIETGKHRQGGAVVRSRCSPFRCSGKQRNGGIAERTPGPDPNFPCL
ncbi:hypothetical protein ACOMHN_066453 [Nucella lapillus]